MLGKQFPEQERVGLGKGKSLPDLGIPNMHILSLNQTNDAERQGAIKRDTQVLAYLENNRGEKELALAKIVEATVVPGYKKSFKYYITFEGQNRRMDRWLKQDDLVTDSADVAKMVRQRDKAARRQHVEIEGGLFENDENKGMDKKQIKEHEDATKVKTID